MLPVTHEHTRNDLNRADLTSLGCVAALIGLSQAITNLSSIPHAVYPFLEMAAVFASGVVGATIWTLWPRRINCSPRMPGSWLHARRAETGSELVEVYARRSAAEISAGQVLALAPVAHRKWMAVRVVLPLFAAVIATLLVALIVGLGAQ